MNRFITFLLLLAFAPFQLVQAQSVKLPKKLDQNVNSITEWPMVMMDDTEVTLGDWFAFMQSMYRNDLGLFDPQYEWDNELIMTLAPDRNAIDPKLHDQYDSFINQFMNKEFGAEFGEEFGFGYNSSQSFEHLDESIESSEFGYPVTGISLEQVWEYMGWRETLINNDKKVKKANIEATARLISPEEWDKFAKYSGPKLEATIYPDSMNEKGCFTMHIKVDEPCPSTEYFLEEYGAGSFPIIQWFPDSNGLYDVYGNVAEMTSERGIAKGGSYMHWASEGYTGEVITYSKPEMWLGFRVLFEFRSVE